MNIFETLKKRWYVLIAIFLGIAIFLPSWFGLITIFDRGSYATLSVYELNKSFIQQGDQIPLTEEDFKEFPHLTAIIRDNNQKPTAILDDGTRLYLIPLSYDEMNRFNGRFWSNASSIMINRIIEYKGKYYEYNYPRIH